MPPTPYTQTSGAPTTARAGKGDFADDGLNGNQLDLSPTLIVEDSGPMQQRLRRLLQLIGADAQITTADSIAAAQAHLGESASSLALIGFAVRAAPAAQWLLFSWPRKRKVTRLPRADESSSL